MSASLTSLAILSLSALLLLTSCMQSEDEGSSTPEGEPSVQVGVLSEEDIQRLLADASSAKDQGDSDLAFDLYSHAAELGSPKAAAELALSYVTGSGTRKDYAAAREWAQRAIDGGETSSILVLVAVKESLAPLRKGPWNNYQTDPDIDQLRQAIDLLESSLGYPPAAHVLGDLYLDGLSVKKGDNIVAIVEKDEEKALELFRKAGTLQSLTAYAVARDWQRQLGSTISHSTTSDDLDREDP